MTPADPNAVDTRARRRQRLIEDYTRIVYGPVPADGRATAEILRRTGTSGGERLEIGALLEAGGLRRHVRLALYRPAGLARPGLFLGPNYAGNASVDPDPAIELGDGWMRPEPGWGIVANRAGAATRGVHAARWPLAKILARGYAVATWHDGDVCPDDPVQCRAVLESGFGGAIAAWAWGFSRMLDAIEPLGLVDPARIAAIGHSRHGKAALWAAANDPRIGLVVANNTGAGGARPWRDAQGETIAQLFERFPHWFHSPLAAYAGRERELPFEQHELLALAAPRGVLVASADDDAWAGPADERRAVDAARPLFAASGREDAIGWQRRPGGHGVEPGDWDGFLAFADRILFPARGA